MTNNAGEGLGEVVRWLRRERETARQELALSQQEALRLRQDCARHQREAAAAQAEAQAVRDRGRADGSGGQAEHAAHLERLDNLNLLKESNTTLRCVCVCVCVWVHVCVMCVGIAERAGRKESIFVGSVQQARRPLLD